MISAAGAVFRGAFARNRARTLVATVAIALGVALGYAVQLINTTAVNEMALGVQTLSGVADLEIRGPRGGFDEALYPRVATMREVAVASPIVELDAKLAGRADTLHVVGLDVFRAGTVTPALVPETKERLDALRSDTLFLTPAAARALGVEVGGTVRLQAGLEDVAFAVAGLLAAGGGQRFAVLDIAGAQWRFDRLGRLTRIDLRVAPGVDVAAFRAALARQLPPGLAVERPQATIDASARLSRAYRVNLEVLALVALFTGGLLVFSTQALGVVRRRAQFALLRVLGVTRRRLVALIVAEAAAIGVAGSALGLVAGYVLAQLALDWIGVDLGSGYFRGTAPALAIDPSALALFFVLGVAAAALGSLVPAFDAARAQPALALKAGDEARALAGALRPLWPGLATLALAGLASLLPPVSELPLFGYAAIALAVIGTLMLMPRFTLATLAVVPSPRATPPRLALAQLRHAPAQVAVSLATIVASVSLMVSMATMVASFRHSLDDWLIRILPAELYFRTGAGGDTAYVPPDAQARIAQLRHAPAQVAVSLATIVASVSLMVSMATMVASFRHSLDDWLVRILPAELYFRSSAGGDTAYVPPDAQARIAQLAGVRRAEFLRETQLLLDPGRPRVVLLARPVDPARFGERLPLVGRSVEVAPGAPPPVWASEAMADLYGFMPGKVVGLPLAGRSVAFTVAGVFRDYARQQGAIVIDRDRYVALTGDRAITNGALWLASGATPAEVASAIRRDVPGGDKLEIVLPGEIRAASLTIFDRTFAVTYALELAAVVIGLVGLSSSFGALVLARRREFGMLRHIGMTRRQIGAMLATEGAAVSGVGLAVGVALGLLISLVLIHVVNRQAFHWGMELAVPWLSLAGFTLAVLLLATLTAVASGRAAMGSDVVRAVKEDW